MSAGTPQTRKVFYLRKSVKESLTRKTAKYRGWNKYLDLRMTQGSLLRFIFSPLACDNRGPNWFKHLLGEYRIAHNFYFPYCEIA